MIGPERFLLPFQESDLLKIFSLRLWVHEESPTKTENHAFLDKLAHTVVSTAWMVQNFSQECKWMHNRFWTTEMARVPSRNACESSVSKTPTITKFTEKQKQNVLQCVLNKNCKPYESRMGPKHWYSRKIQRRFHINMI